MGNQNPLAVSLKLLWEGVPESVKGPRPRLKLRQVICAAIELADKDGLEALSMRKLAQKLGVGTMSLYRYVPSKDDLLNLMLDAVVGPSQERADAPKLGWREFLMVTAHEGRQLYLSHPWTMQANWGRPVLGPNSVGDLDLFMAGLEGLPLSDREKMNLATTLDSYVLGSVRQELMWRNAAAESEMTDEEFWSYQLPTLEQAMASGRFPALAQLSEDTFEGSYEESFTMGLQLMLDGLEEQLARRRASS